MARDFRVAFRAVAFDDVVGGVGNVARRKRYGRNCLVGQANRGAASQAVEMRVMIIIVMMAVARPARFILNRTRAIVNAVDHSALAEKSQRAADRRAVDRFKTHLDLLRREGTLGLEKRAHHKDTDRRRLDSGMLKCMFDFVVQRRDGLRRSDDGQWLRVMI